MINRFLLISGLASAMLLSGQAVAVPYSSLDTRSFAMGGTGVAAGNRSNAVLMNPALLSISDEKKNFNLELPVFGYHRVDEKGGRSEADIYHDNQLETDFNQKMDAFSVVADVNSNEALAARIEVARAGQAIINQLEKMSSKVDQSELFVAVVATGGNDKIDFSLLVDSRVVAGGLFRVQNSDISSVQAIIDLAGAGTLPQNDPFRVNATTMDSTFEMRGAIFEEVALAVSRDVEVAGHSFALGLTPKYVNVTVFDYLTEINDATFNKDLNTTDYSDFNMDVGVAKAFDNGWKVGLVVKDLVAHDYFTVLGNTIKIKPQMRAGVARKDDWSTLTLDVDLNQSESVGFDSKTQYVAVGAELDVTKTLQMRMGYRNNMADSKTSILTFGAGISFSSVHLNLAAGLNEDALGYSIQLGFQF